MVRASEAVAEKVFLAEKNTAAVRVGVITLNSLVYLTLMDRSTTIEWLAYAVIATALPYGFFVLLYQPYRRYRVLLSSVFTAATDGTLITLWLLATGGVASPFYVLWYVSILAVAFRYTYRETLLVAVAYAAAYVGLAVALDQLAGNAVAMLIRTSYIFFIGLLAGMISRELLEQTRAKVKMRNLMREARLAEARFRGLLEAAPDAIVITNAHAEVVLINDQTEHLFGTSRDELLGKPVTALLPPEVTQSVIEEADADAGPSDTNSEETVGFEVAGQRRDGTTFPCEVRLRPIRTRDGAMVTIIIRDVTERKRAERQLEERANELARSNAELEQFAYVASHDLQEPLRMVASYVQLLERRYRDELDEDAGTFIDFAVEGATRMQNLINDLLAFSRVGTGGNPLVPTDGGEVLDRVLATLAMTIEDTGATITHDEMPIVRADARQIEQVLQNLISNAMKFHGDEPPRVHISAERDGDEWVIGVHDNGIGVDPAFQDRIFTIFQRLHTRDRYQGTGIGLSICKKIVERHGGRIWVESRGSAVAADIEPDEADAAHAQQVKPSGPEHGSVFRFTLPAAAAGEHEGPRRLTRRDTRRPSDAIARRARELI